MRNPAIPAQVESRRCSSQIASPVQRNRPESVVLAYGTRCRNLPSLSSFASNRMTIFILPLRIVECGGGSSDRVRTRLSLLLRKSFTDVTNYISDGGNSVWYQVPAFVRY
nr:uncharacterized protein LOC101250290 isoform X3 [Solanum lycopersicum]